MKEIWIRAGVALQVTEEESDVLLSQSGRAAGDTIRSILEEGRLYFTGNSYIPATVVETFNEAHGTSFPLEEPEFELPVIGAFSRTEAGPDMAGGPALTM